jgi:hypothetical protein
MRGTTTTRTLGGQSGLLSVALAALGCVVTVAAWGLGSRPPASTAAWVPVEGASSLREEDAILAP